jgi:hypothetical protein
VMKWQHTVVRHRAPQQFSPKYGAPGCHLPVKI